MANQPKPNGFVAPLAARLGIVPHDATLASLGVDPLAQAFEALGFDGVSAGLTAMPSVWQVPVEAGPDRGALALASATQAMTPHQMWDGPLLFGAPTAEVLQLLDGFAGANALPDLSALSRFAFPSSMGNGTGDAVGDGGQGNPPTIVNGSGPGGVGQGEGSLGDWDGSDEPDGDVSFNGYYDPQIYDRVQRTVVEGSSDADTITATETAEKFFGFDGADVFVFADVKSSLPDAPDVIMDFTPGVDKLDLTGLELDVTMFTFTSMSSMPGVFVSVDRDGDGTTDFALRVVGDINLGEITIRDILF